MNWFIILRFNAIGAPSPAWAGEVLARGSPRGFKRCRCRLSSPGPIITSGLSASTIRPPRPPPLLPALRASERDNCFSFFNSLLWHYEVRLWGLPTVWLVVLDLYLREKCVLTLKLSLHITLMTLIIPSLREKGTRELMPSDFHVELDSKKWKEGLTLK